MAAPTRGLTPTDIGAIREQLSAGRKPRIVFTESAGQIAGQQGHVVALTDPAGSDEWIVVQFGRDELPFAPVDLATPTRGGAAATRSAAASPGASTGAPSGAKAGPARRAARPEPEPERPPLKLTEPPAKPGRSAAKAPSANGASANGTSANGTSANGTSANGASSNGVSANAAPSATADPKNGTEPRPAKVAKPKAPASLTVTLSYADREWTVSASLGTRTLAKPYLIKPTEALRMVALVDVPGVHEAVESIIVAERAEAESRAARLRNELAEIETRLAELAGRS